MESTVLVIKDETSGGKILNEINISVDTNKLTVKEIIEARVLHSSTIKVYWQYPTIRDFRTADMLFELPQDIVFNEITVD